MRTKGGPFSEKIHARPWVFMVFYGTGNARSANRPVYGEVARAKRVTEGQNYIKIRGRFVNRPYNL